MRFNTNMIIKEPIWRDSRLYNIKYITCNVCYRPHQDLEIIAIKIGIICVSLLIPLKNLFIISFQMAFINFKSFVFGTLIHECRMLEVSSVTSDILHATILVVFQYYWFFVASCSYWYSFFNYKKCKVQSIVALSKWYNEHIIKYSYRRIVQHTIKGD